MGGGTAARPSPFDTIREALNLHKSMYLSGDGHTAFSVTVWGDALAQLTEVEQQLADLRNDNIGLIEACKMDAARAVAAETALADCKKYRDAETRALAKRCGAAERRAHALADALRRLAQSGNKGDAAIARDALDRQEQT
jgi:hypothetical protein